MQTEINDFQSKISRLTEVKNELINHRKVGGKEAVNDDMKLLESDWSRVEKVTRQSLDTLWAEHSCWVQEKIKMMNSFISKGESLLDIELKFVKTYPLEELLVSKATELTEEVREIVTTHEVCTNMYVYLHYLWYVCMYMYIFSAVTIYMYLHVFIYLSIHLEKHVRSKFCLVLLVFFLNKQLWNNYSINL